MRISTCVPGVVLAAPLSAQVALRVSVGTGGMPGNGDSIAPSISADGPDLTETLWASID
jgi:hypothetical protein